MRLRGSSFSFFHFRLSLFQIYYSDEVIAHVLSDYTNWFWGRLSSNRVPLRAMLLEEFFYGH